MTVYMIISAYLITLFKVETSSSSPIFQSVIFKEALPNFLIIPQFHEEHLRG